MPFVISALIFLLLWNILLSYYLWKTMKSLRSAWGTVHGMCRDLGPFRYMAEGSLKDLEKRVSSLEALHPPETAPAQPKPRGSKTDELIALTRAKWNSFVEFWCTKELP